MLSSIQVMVYKFNSRSTVCCSRRSFRQPASRRGNHRDDTGGLRQRIDPNASRYLPAQDVNQNGRIERLVVSATAISALFDLLAELSRVVSRVTDIGVWPTGQTLDESLCGEPV